MDEWKKEIRYSYIDDEQKENIKTARQWALRGFVAKDPEGGGAFLYPNSYSKNMYKYYSLEEVREASAEELQAFFKPERERANRKAEERKEERKRLKPLTDMRKKCKALAGAVPYNPKRRNFTIVIDTETTGLDSEKDELLQVSIIDAYTGATLFNEYVKPVLAKHWDEAQRVNGISPRKVSRKPCIDNYIERLQGILNKTETIIGYNVGFDISFLQAAGLTFRLSSSYNCIDVMEDFADYMESGHFYKLTDCARYFGYDWGEHAAHNSLGDCKATLYCYNELEDLKL